MVLRDAEQSRLQDSSRVWTSRKSTIPCGTRSEEYLDVDEAEAE